MASRPQRLPYEAAARDLVVAVKAAQQTIVMQVRAAIRSGDLATAQRRRMQLAAVLATLDQLGAATEPAARRVVEEAFADSAGQAGKRLDKIGVSVQMSEGAFTAVNHDAVQVLAESLTGRLRLARETVGRSVADIYGRAQRRVALQATLGANGSPVAARNELMTQLARDRDVGRLLKDSRGLTGFVDKAGKRWALDTYSEMVVRTVTREAVSQAALLTYASEGVDLVRVSEHGTQCDICGPWEGRLVSLDGGTSEYQGEAVASIDELPDGGPPMHPNCKHSWEPVSTMVDEVRAEMEVEA